MGGGWRLFALHARGRNRRAARRRRSRRRRSPRRQQAAYLRETADIWNGLIERWIYAAGTPLAKELGVEGYYVRIAPPETGRCGLAASTASCRSRTGRPRTSGQPASLMVSPDALALVRFGLRAPDDPRIRNTVRVIDALLKVDLPAGPCWRRYNGDGYGEHEDGRAVRRHRRRHGRGRCSPASARITSWPPAIAPPRQKLLATLEGFASDGHLLPEQVWDAPDIPERELFRGRPSGSAMPLVWAHAEHVKLLRSLADGRVFDMPPQPRQRYQIEGVRSRHCVWRFNNKCRRLTAGSVLRVELLAAAAIHWSSDAWRTIRDTPTQDSGFGIHFADLDTAGLAAGGGIVFTIHWTADERWEGVDYALAIE